MPASEDALFSACESGTVEEVEQLAGQLEGDIRKLTASNGANCLHIAAHAGRSDLCKYLLDTLAFDINSQDDGGKGSTSLVLALDNDHWATAELLLSYHPDVNRRSEAEGAPAPLHLAVAAGQVELARALLAAGADVNAPSGSGNPLMLAAARSSDAMLQLLLGAGADVRECARQGLTPLFMAVHVGGALACVEVLIKAGADVNARALGFTPLHVAAESGKVELAEALLQAGADPDAKDEHGHSPARVAAMHGHRAVVEAILRRGTAGASEAPAGPSSSMDQYMAAAKKDLKEREEKTPSSSDGSSAIRIPEPELSDEGLSDTFKRKGNELFVAGDYQTAAEVYGLALSHWTKNAVVWSNRAACHLRLERWAKAMQDAQVARTLDPSYVKAWYREGRAAEGLQRYEDAATAYYQASLLQPENEEFISLTKDAIVEGRKQLQAQQAQQAQGQEAGGQQQGKQLEGQAAGEGPAAADKET